MNKTSSPQEEFKVWIRELLRMHLQTPVMIHEHMGVLTHDFILLQILDSRLYVIQEFIIQEYDIYLLHISKKGDMALLTSITSKRSVDTCCTLY